MNVDPVLFAKAIADDTRQEIMKHLCCVWLSVNDVVDKLGGKVNQPTVSHHLKKLEEANLVEVRQEGRQRFYTLNRNEVEVCCNTLVYTFAPDYAEQFMLANAPITSQEIASDMSFTEGQRVRITHLRIERNPKLRKLFLEMTSRPILCDICGIDGTKIYPWVENLIEIHHLLPLASAAALGQHDTLLQDLVPLCPNCHKSIHLYYSQWLRQNSQSDFANVEEAKRIYEQAKNIVKSDTR